MLPKWCVVIYKVVLDIERVVSYNEGDLKAYQNTKGCIYGFW